ncbi:Wzz/FepE/Etk N-terminal domain-containing protein [Limibacterium fermenti]|uniref:Wzz/FepE/Etk N-terminal domain-containing protein n=1 Tax=Limibacterium fermenti TaxID=3229863 RepID=UPI000E867E60|nr:lipopolysaccharide biosynthesis protein [Porphyromonadaceae bacterium]
MSSQTSLPPSADLPPAVQEDEIDLVDILRRLWLKRRFILWVTGAFLLLGVFIALFSPVKYTASCTVVPQSGKDGSGGNLGGIAAMMGVNMGGMGSSETLSPTVYPQIIKSVPFTREIMQTPIRVEKSGGKSISLYDYYTDKQYQSFNLLDGIKRYTIGLPGLLIGAMRGTSVQEASTDSVSTMLALTDEEERVYKTIQSSLTQNFNQKDGYLTLEYSFPEAEGAAQITDQVRKTLGKYVMSFKSEKAEDNLAFVEQSYEDARKDFLEKQSRLASFRDANRGLTTATAQATEQRLRSEYDLAFSVYSELAKQREQAKLSVKETKPVLTVIEPVVVPSQKSAPRRGIILIGCLFLGFIIGCGWVFLQPFLKDIRKEIREEDKPSAIV